MAVSEEVLDVFLADILDRFGTGATQVSEKGFQISPIGGNGIGRQPALDGQVLEKGVQQVGVVGRLQGVSKRYGEKKTPRRENRQGVKLIPGFASG